MINKYMRYECTPFGLIIKTSKLSHKSFLVVQKFGMLACGLILYGKKSM